MTVIVITLVVFSTMLGIKCTSETVHMFIPDFIGIDFDLVVLYSLPLPIPANFLR